ncbi:MAG: cyclic nucleotide-binding/CBS domain-containing protein [Actinomycetota bacterium]
MTTIRDIMSGELVAVSPSTTVAEAATAMAERRVGSALVLDGGLVGIFTERDIVRALSQDFDAPGHPVSHWMTRNPTTIGPDAAIQDALDLMLSAGFRHLPVMEGDEVVGVVSIRDLSKATSES